MPIRKLTKPPARKSPFPEAGSTTCQKCGELDTVEKRQLEGRPFMRCVNCGNASRPQRTEAQAKTAWNISQADDEWAPNIDYFRIELRPGQAIAAAIQLDLISGSWKHSDVDKDDPTKVIYYFHRNPTFNGR